MSWERKQPKRETTLVRLTRQAKAINKMVAHHEGEVHTQLNRLERQIADLSKKYRDEGAVYDKGYQALQDEYDAMNDLLEV